MPRSVPDDDMMDSQQSRDLGHATKSPTEQARDAAKETAERRLARDTRANRGLGTLIPPDKESETAEALKRAAYPPKRMNKPES